MYSGVLQRSCDFSEVQIILPNHLLAFVKFDAADVFTGGNLQIFMEKGCQITGTDIHHPGYQRNR